MYINSRYHDAYDWSMSTTLDKSDITYNRFFLTRTVPQPKVVRFDKENYTKKYKNVFKLFVGVEVLEFNVKTNTFFDLFIRSCYKKKVPFEGTKLSGFEYNYRPEYKVSSDANSKYSGKIVLNDVLTALLASKFFFIERKLLNNREGQPVELHFEDKIFCNISIQASGLEIPLSVTEQGAAIEAFLTKQSPFDISERDNDTKITAHGFDLKQSFRDRKNSVD